ncbi:MAG: glycoside hydrolase family 2 [Clostridiales bacterium]|jgi:beta-galactosidase/beta-glucuronidase|nr:glycoside hydrolase family 2 [Clostridiales bacterium]
MKTPMKFERLPSAFKDASDKRLPLPEYPRPQMARDSYINLNGLWDYAILPIGEKLTAYQGKILVPFSPESLLSGVERTVTPSDALYYRRTFGLPDGFKKGRVLLHFGAVDYRAEIFVNGYRAFEHRGGYNAFYIDITAFLSDGDNVLTLTVTDPSDDGVGACGKQKIDRGGIFYTPQSGIWQTVWLESVPKNYIKSLRITPNIDAEEVLLEIDAPNCKNAEVTIYDGDKPVASGLFDCGISDNGGDSHGFEVTASAVIKLSDAKLWSPEQPFLYDARIVVDDDTVTTYFGMRKFGIEKDDKGIPRLTLNNRPYFHNGLLDQGYYSDGLYTPPSDAAMRFDIESAKRMGFNTLRKHIKVEPLRWYYHCDRIGMLVWQDMVNGGARGISPLGAIRGFLGLRMKDSYKPEGRCDSDRRAEFYRDTKNTLDALYNVVSIAVWVPFNEGWGQFDAKKVYDFVRSIDKTRAIDHASGWHDQGCGDFKSLHIYFKKIKVPKDVRPIILSEYGGYSLKIDGHIFNKNKIFGYRKFNDPDSLSAAYRALIDEQIVPMIPRGLTAAIYTQLTDVEDEVNGFITYDRKIFKIDPAVLAEINGRVKLKSEN